VTIVLPGVAACAGAQQSTSPAPPSASPAPPSASPAPPSASAPPAPISPTSSPSVSLIASCSPPTTIPSSSPTLSVGGGAGLRRGGSGTGQQWRYKLPRQHNTTSCGAGCCFHSARCGRRVLAQAQDWRCVNHSSQKEQNHCPRCHNGLWHRCRDTCV
jgi:hypothetical protein